MDIWTAVRIVARRWYVFLPGLVATVLALFVISSAIKPEYQTSGSLILLAPQDQSELEPTQNPYLRANSSLRTTGVVLEQIISSNPRRDLIAASGVQGSYEITASDDSPTLVVVAVAKSPDDAIDIAEVVFDAVEQELQVLQDSVAAPDTQRITADRLISPETVEQLAGSRSRALLTFFILGLVASATAAVAFDGIMAFRRRKWRRDEPSDVPSDAPHEAPTAAALTNGPRRWEYPPPGQD